MTIETTINRKEYTGNGSTVDFSFPYYFLADADLKVYVDDTLKTITTDYTVSGAGDAAGGTVTFGTAPADTLSIVILRDPAITQSTDWVENDPDSAETKEEAFDRLTMICQRLSDRIGRSLVLSDGDAVSTDLTLPTPVANKLLAINSDASGISLADFTDNIFVSQESTPTTDGSLLLWHKPSTGVLHYLSSGAWSEIVAGTGDLLSTNNLSDVDSAATSRANLGLGDAALKTVGTASGNLTEAQLLARLAANNVFTARQDWAKGSDVASANDCVLATDGNLVDITGTTQINGFTNQAAGVVTVCRFAGALTLAHNASPGAGYDPVLLPGSSNITTAAGDILVLFSNGVGNAFRSAYLKIDGTSVVASAPASSSVGQGELKTSTASQSVAVSNSSHNSLTLTGGTYSLQTFFRHNTGGTELDITCHVLRSASNAAVVSFRNDSASTATIYAYSRYITASPPYDLGDGEIPCFVYVLIENGTNSVLATYVAQDPPWAYNGEDRIDPNAIVKDEGKQYLREKQMGGKTWASERSKGKAATVTYLDDLLEAPETLTPLTMERKMRGSAKIPHPWAPGMSNIDTRGAKVVLLDPLSPLMPGLKRAMDLGEIDLSELIHDGDIVINKTPIPGRKTLPGVEIRGFDWA